MSFENRDHTLRDWLIMPSASQFTIEGSGEIGARLCLKILVVRTAERGIA